MVKVLHIYKTFFPESVGGIEQYIYNTCKATEKHGISHSIICTTPSSTKETSIFNGITVLKYPYTIKLASCPMSFNLLMKFKDEVKHADIIHYHYPWPFANLLALFAKHKKCLVTYHSDIVRQKFLRKVLYPLDQYFLYKADQIIATSTQYANLSTNLRRFAPKVKVIPITISRNNYPSIIPHTCSAIKEKFGQFYLFIGQLRHYKGLDILIEAIKGTKLKLLIIGDGPKKRHLQQLCANNGIDNVVFLGNLSEQDKVNYLQACFGVILPSNSKAEAFGISLLEGAMFKKPLISCNIKTGVEHVNKHMETGLVVSPTEHHLRNAMTKLFATPKLAEKMGNQAFNRFQQHFNYDIIGMKLADLYKRLAEKKKQHDHSSYTLWGSW